MDSPLVIYAFGTSRCCRGESGVRLGFEHVVVSKVFIIIVDHEAVTELEALIFH